MHPVEIVLTPIGRMFRGRHADESASISHAPELATEQLFALTSPNFAEGEEIPAKHCGAFIGQNVSPALRWDALPAGTTELLLVMEDLDNPRGAPRIHAVASFPPDEEGLGEGALTRTNPTVQFLPGGKYQGPRPMPGHGPHHYRFHLYALDAPIHLATVAGITRLPAAVDGHVLASGILTGTRTS